jgi:hypothetical protein
MPAWHATARLPGDLRKDLEICGVNDLIRLFRLKIEFRRDDVLPGLPAPMAARQNDFR